MFSVVKEKALADRRIIFGLKGLIVGIIAGIIVSLFRLGIEILLEKIVEIYHSLAGNPLAIVGWVIVSIIAAFILGKLIKSEPNIKGSGIPQVEGQVQGLLRLNWWAVLWKKSIGGILAIGSGLFLGREGPSIQLGAVVGQGVSEMTNGDEISDKILISSGAGAGLAAAFNAPVAGLIFVLEEIHHNFSPLVALTTFIATVTANFVSLNIFGLKPALDIGAVTSLPVKYYGSVVLLGILLALAGWVYSRILLSLSGWYSKVTFLPPHLYSIIPFLAIIPLGVFLPDILGGGSGIILNLEGWQLSLGVLVALFAIRFVFSMLSYGSGLPGGIFLPILSLGAILGAIFATVLQDYFGLPTGYMTHFIIFAMAGYFTAIGKAPLTAILLVTEMVGGLNQLMPLAICSLSAFFTADLLGVPPIYEALLERLVEQKTSSQKGKRHVFELPINAESKLVGSLIRDVKWPEHTLVTAIRRGNREIIAGGLEQIRTGDCLLLITDEGLLKVVQDELESLN